MGYPDQQFLFVERFRYEVVGPGFETPDDVGRSVQRGQKDDRDVSCFRILFQLFGDLESVQTGHHDIQQDQIRLFRLYGR